MFNIFNSSLINSRGQRQVDRPTKTTISKIQMMTKEELGELNFSRSGWEELPFDGWKFDLKKDLQKLNLVKCFLLNNNKLRLIVLP